MRDSREDHYQDERVEGKNLPPQLAEDQFYQALAASQRRRLLYYLLAEEQCTVDELATVLGGWEATTSGTMHTPDDRAGVRLALIHSHLPKLDEAGLIDYEPQDGSIQLASLHPQVSEIIRQSVEAEQRTESWRCSTR